jgi:hypothetical protein
LVPSSHQLGYMEAIERRNYRYYIKLGYTSPKGLLGNFIVAPSDGCPGTANLLRLDASLVIPMCVLRFEASGSRRRTPVRPVSSTGQTGLLLLHLHLWSELCGSTKEPSGFLVNHWKPRELGVASASLHSRLGHHEVPARSCL